MENNKGIRGERKSGEEQVKIENQVEGNHRAESFNSGTEPFNSAVDHYQKHMGLPAKKVDLQTMPKWLKYFYYGVITFILIGFLLMIYVSLFK